MRGLLMYYLQKAVYKQRERTECSMKIIPSIDIKSGRCVRLLGSAFQESEVLSYIPAQVAKRYEEQGATYIHVLDLDGVMAGHIVNEDVIRDIVQAVSIPVQVGGGIRTIKDIEQRMNLGISRVVLGTAAVSDPAFVKEAISHFGAEKIVISIDVKNGMVAKDGWENSSNYNATLFGYQMKRLGIQTVIYTEVHQNGMLATPNYDCASELIKIQDLEVIVAGSFASMKDLERLSAAGVQGALVREGMYEKKLELESAIRLFA